MTRNHPVQLSVVWPARYDRVQVALRLAVGMVLGFVGVTGGWVWCLLYLALPVVAAVAISSRGTPAYLGDAGAALWRALAWITAFFAYMLLLTDRFPTGEHACRVELRPTGAPTPGRALARLVTSLPIALVLSVLWMISGVLVVLGWITILVAERVPDGLRRYQEGVLRASARWLAYHAALVAEYPPLWIDLRNDCAADHPARS